MRRKQELIFNVHRQHVLYIMTKSFRIRNNYSLYEAIKYSKDHGLKLDILVVEPEEESRMSFDFFRMNTTDLVEKLHAFSRHVKITDSSHFISHIHENIEAIFMDFAYLRFDIKRLDLLKQKAKELSINLYQVESNVFVPVKDASDKEEYGAFTIRRKITRLLPYYDQEVLVDASTTMGEKAAFKVLNQFIEKKLPMYDDHNDPSKQLTSRLSVYLKFGMISPVTIYQLLKPIDEDIKASFLEELIVRRELAYNYVYYNPNYDKFSRMTEPWAYLTMKDHENDPRPYHYTMNDYIHFKTHDPYFNAAMKEMVYKGYMHSYMRMYWAKKIIEWSRTYQEAYKIAITLNNRYFLDGLTPNGYTGVAWCFGKHDRPWKERPIFGKLRYMNDQGLKRKFDIDRYVLQMDLIEKECK